MKTEKVQKTNWGYLLGYILGPILLLVVGGLVGYYVFADGGTGAVVCFMGAPILVFAWYMVAGRAFYKMGVKKMEQAMDAQGLVRNQTFNGRGCTVCVDLNKGMLGLAFFWNPFKPYIIPASRVVKAWVDDGGHGSGIMRGSSQVSFLFQLDEVKVRVYTFTSNRRWRMDSDYILTGISKADKMVEVLESAKSKAG